MVTKMTIRKAREDDIEIIMNIYDYAHEFMRENGNPTQWPSTYPSEEIVKEDIASQNCYVCEEMGEVMGVFSFFIGEDPTYGVIEQGNWHCDKTYGTIHRLAGSKDARGIARACFSFCKNQIDYLRADTHTDNKPMQGALIKNGFRRCGIIYLANGNSRIAFDFHQSF